MGHPASLLVARIPKALGRSRIISEKVYKLIRNMIETGYSRRKALIYFQILDALPYRCGTVISSDTLRHIVRTMPGVKTVIGVAMEAEGVVMDPEEINRWFHGLT
jgi:hypothetical protein